MKISINLFNFVDPSNFQYSTKISFVSPATEMSSYYICEHVTPNNECINTLYDFHDSLLIFM